MTGLALGYTQYTHINTHTLYKILNFSLYHMIWAIFLTAKLKLVANRLNSENQKQLVV